jgi:mannose-1-phosphate guanylyltransferase
MGIEPTYPSEKYGYIIPEKKTEISTVRTVKEKPDVKTAEHYIAQGALWNGGVFAYKLSYVLGKAHELLGTADYRELFERYETLEKISFDYAVAEHETSIQVLRFTGDWKDIGTWNTLAEEMNEQTQGNVILDETCENVTVINELSIPVLCMGMRDTVVAVSGDGVLVSDRGQSSYIKPYADKITGQIMYADKSWGTFTVLDVQDESMTICIRMQPGHRLTYHSHEHRDEVWTIVSG